MSVLLPMESSLVPMGVIPPPENFVLLIPVNCPAWLRLRYHPHRHPHCQYKELTQALDAW